MATNLEEYDQAVAAGEPLLRQVIDGVVGKALPGADVRRVYGEPIVTGERTVVPVAEIRGVFGFGAGGGRAPGGEGADAGAGEGGGGGGGGKVTGRPVGYLEITPTTTRFVPIVDVSRLAVIGATSAALILILRAMRKPRS